MKKLNAGIIGCGDIAGGYDEKSGFRHIFTHAGAYKKHPRFVLTACAETNVLRKNDFCKIWNVPKGFTSYIDMLENLHFDIISICVPDRIHYEVLNFILKKNLTRRILVEKPFVTTSEQAFEILELCRRQNISLYVNCNRRWDPLHLYVKSLIQNGFLGDLQTVTGYYVRGLIHNGTTMVNTLRYLLPEKIISVQALDSTASTVENDPALDGILYFTNNICVFLLAADKFKYGHSIFEINLLGNKGRIALLDNGFKVELYQTTEYKRYGGFNELKRIKKSELPKLPKSALTHSLSNTLNEIYFDTQNDIFSIKHGAEAMIDLKVADSLLKSLANNRMQINL